MILCADRDGVIVEWVRRLVPHVDDFGKCSALGLTSENGAPLAGAVYHDYRPEYGTLDGPRTTRLGFSSGILS